MAEKITTEVKLHLPESLKRDLQDAAHICDRSLSEYCRLALIQHLYGVKYSGHHAAAQHADASPLGAHHG